MPPKEHTQRIEYPDPTTCALHTAELMRIGRTVDDIHKRLFVSNGDLCITAKIQRLDGFAKIALWVVGIFTTVLCGIIIKVFTP